MKQQNIYKTTDVTKYENYLTIASGESYENSSSPHGTMTRRTCALLPTLHHVSGSELRQRVDRSLVAGVEVRHRRVLGLGRHELSHLRLGQRVHVLQVPTQVLHGAEDLLAAGTRRQPHMDLHVTHQRLLVLVFPEADVAHLSARV